MRGIMKYVNRIHRSMGVVYNNRLREYGINHCQHPYILLICQYPGITQEELTRSVCVNKSNVTRQLASLEGEGYLTRRPDEDDKRLMRVYPTEKMEALLPHVREVMGDWNALLLEGFSEEERAKLISMLEIITIRATEAAHSTLRGSERSSGEKEGGSR